MQNALRVYEQSETKRNELKVYKRCKKETLTEQFGRVFQAQNGIQCIMQKGENGNVSQYFTKNLAHEIKRQSGQRDVYFTVNSFYKQKRHANRIREINALYVDLDLKTVEIEYFDEESLFNATVETQIGFLEMICEENGLPPFTAVVKSGSGYHLYWKIEAIPVWSIRVRKSWQKTENEFVNRLAYYGSDPGAKVVGQLLRLPLTLNGKYKSKRAVEVLFVDEARQYENRDLYKEFFPDSKPYDPNKFAKWDKKSTPKTRASRIHYLHNENSLYKARMSDLNKLIEIREGHMPKKKQNLLFIMACLHTTGEMEGDLYDLLTKTNDKFDDPVEEKELLYLVKQQTSGRLKYRFRNTTIIDYLTITEDEQQELKTIITKDEKQRRQAQRKREQYAPTKKRNQDIKNERDKRVMQLRSEGYTNASIAKELNISLSTVKRIIRKTSE